MKCPKCGFENDIDALFCEKCGSSLLSEKANNTSWIRRNLSWVCVLAGLLLLFVYMILHEERFFRYDFREVFFFASDCLVFFIIGGLVGLSKILCNKPSITRWKIWLLFSIGAFLLFQISECMGRDQSAQVLALFLILVWAYSIAYSIKRKL